MPFRYLLILLSCCLYPGITQAALPTRIPAQATISAVTVYLDRAQVTRTVTVALKPGSQIIAVEGLPVLLQDDSVRVDAKGTARATITGIEVKRSFLAQTADKRIKEIEGELKQLERKLGGLDARKAGLLAQKGFVDSIKVAWGERISQQLAIGKPTAAELNEAMGFVGSNTVKVEDQQRDIEQEKQIIKEQMDALKRKKQEATGSYRKESKTVEVAVETTKEGKLTLDLSGVVTQATWEPSYDVRLAQDGTSAELTYRAQVRQQTGEDWNNVPLTLSTARPASGGAPPTLYPWRISFYRPMPMAMPAAAPMRSYKKAARPVIAENMKADMAMEEEEAPAPAAFQTAQAAAEGTSIAFKIPKPVDIPSDNTRHSTVIALEKLPVSTEYGTVPKLSPVAYLTAELVNKAGWPLLPGSVKIFSGNTFVGSADMKQVASGEKFTLPFGSDDQITVKREELKQHKEAGIFGKNRMGYRSTITVTNFRKEVQTISVKDQLPLAGDSEIKINLEEATLPPTEKKDDGTLIWKMKLAAGEKKVFSYEIVVEYPKDREVTGL
ncbi:MAG: mucoidy inhibitor MuiA family protein [Trichlorobacter sp.]|uniref:mucoidy inhibitor MuiA family protein n=1 Tax=Trichlorobacter sp. TaxID=2911007 RepID=UPI0025632032|nr:mucoidy inhibitor MuiA family protein [Trichlorobacter sp.]MDK9718911.1 mucoidy inhibitor MuiA family protein [Trichlorobacter sp.]